MKTTPLNLNNEKTAAKPAPQCPDFRYFGPIKSIAFIFAMEQEALPFIQALDLKLERFSSPNGAGRVFRGEVYNLEVIVSINAKDKRFGVDRVGTESSILNTFLICQKYRPSLIVNAGTAGGFEKRGAAIGDVYLSEGPICFHDHRIGIPGFHEFGVGSYPALQTKNLQQVLKLKTGNVSTGNSLDISDIDYQILESNNVHIKEMEAAAIAQVADDQEIAFMAFKSITDLVDGDQKTTEEFLQNLSLASSNLQKKLCEFIDFVKEGKNLEEL